MHAKCVIEDNDEAGIRPNKTFLALANEAGGPSNLGFSEKDLRNYIAARLQTSDVNADVTEMMNYFMRMKDINLNFFYAANLDEECMHYCLRHLSVSTTMLMGKVHGNCSTGIITDQCRSMCGAIRKALLDTRHCWCILHIMKKLLHKLGDYRWYRKLYADLNNIVWNARMVELFKDNWSEFVAEYNLHNNRRLSDLYDDRRMWVPIFFKGEFWAAMRSTQMSECMHAFYGGFLHSGTSLVQFVNEYNNVLGIKEQGELEDDAADSRGLSLVQ
ncbi:protein FAR1-RELATED SEQUENCE 5-like [Arachis hypogaea]|uniref:protein FAR1-RELATED SEQUENCE 5-like n=1 Tax=Arachis hypogaea TaxID=3818 RepID=UPI0011057423|nr:protein FAR1-RELATED SEQUENCE 5-like [Arachis hypogaea]